MIAYAYIILREWFFTYTVRERTPHKPYGKPVSVDLAETLEICSLRDTDEKFSLHQLDSLSRLSSRDRRRYEIGDCRRHHIDNHQLIPPSPIPPLSYPTMFPLLFLPSPLPSSLYRHSPPFPLSPLLLLFFVILRWFALFYVICSNIFSYEQGARIQRWVRSNWIFRITGMCHFKAFYRRH
jgi:hypothetical protein